MLANRNAALLIVLLFALLWIGACRNAPTAPPATHVAPRGCWMTRHIEGRDGVGATLHAHYADCSQLNVDSLTADGWTITYDAARAGT